MGAKLLHTGEQKLNGPKSKTAKAEGERLRYS